MRNSRTLLTVALLNALTPIAARSAAQDQAAERSTADQVKPLAAGNREFAFKLYAAVCRAPGAANTFISPYSISAALAMTAAGAAGETEKQMLAALQINSVTDPHAVFAALDAALHRSGAKDEHETGDRPTIRIANRLWPRIGETLLPEYLASVRKHYGADFEALNFSNPAAAAATINAWVAAQTEQRIKDLLQPDQVRDASLVLTNAVYFKGSWLQAFKPEATRPGDFTRIDGKVVSVPMMNGNHRLGYTRGEGYQAVELPYVGDEWTMILLLPDAGKFTAFESAMNAAQLEKVTQELKSAQVQLTLPKWTFRSRFSLPPALTSLGMKDAFNPRAANFSRMDGSRELFISDVVHEAFVAVDETGTEAAAATAVVMMRTSVEPRPPIELRVDRPFMFAICDRTTETVLFLGRVTDPTAK